MFVHSPTYIGCWIQLLVSIRFQRSLMKFWFLRSSWRRHLYFNLGYRCLLSFPKSTKLNRGQKLILDQQLRCRRIRPTRRNTWVNIAAVDRPSTRPHRCGLLSLFSLASGDAQARVVGNNSSTRSMFRSVLIRTLRLKCCSLYLWTVLFSFKRDNNDKSLILDDSQARFWHALFQICSRKRSIGQIRSRSS